MSDIHHEAEEIDIKPRQLTEEELEILEED